MVYRSRLADPAATLDLDPILDFHATAVERRTWTTKHVKAEGGQSRHHGSAAVLRIVSQRPGLSPGAVARIVHLHPSTITGILQRLVKKGLLRRDRDSNDHRRIRLHTQAAAREFVAASTGTVESAVTHALARLPCGWRVGPGHHHRVHRGHPGDRGCDYEKRSLRNRLSHGRVIRRACDQP